jgi:hypothetical protein
MGLLLADGEIIEGVLFEWMRATGLVVIDVVEAHASAHLLLSFLRSAFCSAFAGETFALDCKAMVRAKSLEDLSLHQLRAARDLLLACGYIKLVTPAGNRRGGRAQAQFACLGSKVRVGAQRRTPEPGGDYLGGDYLGDCQEGSIKNPQNPGQPRSFNSFENLYEDDFERRIRSSSVRHAT